MPRRPSFAALAAIVCVAGFGGCRAYLPSQLPNDQEWIVAVKSCRLNGGSAWYKSLAHHAWIDLKRGPAGWLRIECGGRLLGVMTNELDDTEARLDRRFGGHDVRLLGWLQGDAAQRAAAAIEARAKELDTVYSDGYRIWPGPNSNTFVYELAAAAPDLGFVFDPNCIGKDWSGWVDAGLVASKTGVRLDTVPIGAAIGLREGVELHLFGTTLGVSLDPPGLSLPFLPQIPWGWLPVAEPVLRAPQIEGATRHVVDAGVLDGGRTDVGVLTAPFVLLFEAADGSGWVRIDGSLGKQVTSGCREFDLVIANHDCEGEKRGLLSGPLDATAPPFPREFRCGAAHGQLEFVELPGDRVQVTALWRRTRGELPPVLR